MDVALVTGRDNPPSAAAVDAPLRAALAARDARVHEPCWDDPAIDWGGYDVAVVRTPWNYVRHRDDFVTWAERTGRRTALWNPAEVLRWNTHKGYLLELEERGAPVVPTAWLAAGDQVDLDAVLRHRGWERAVLKPAVSSDADRVLRTGSRADAQAMQVAQAHLDDLLAVGDAMIQPYLGAVEHEGELSVVLVDGTVSHVVRKLPAAGDFRVQEHLGGDLRPVDPAAASEPASLARWVVEASGHDLLYARVDLLRDDVGTWQLAELEVTEPDLYLRAVPQAATRLAAAILDRANHRRSTATDASNPR